MAALTTHVEQTGSGEPLILIHGVGLDLTTWDRQVAALATRYLVVRYDMLGHGRSTRPPGPYTLEMFVEQLRGLLASLSIARAHIAGFSMGGLVAQGFAAAYPDRVASLALVSTVAGRSREQRQGVLGRLREVEQRGLTAAVEAARQRWFSPDFVRAHPETVNALSRRLGANDPAAYLAAYRLFATADEQLFDCLPAISCPTLIITGELDAGSTPQMAALMQARIPHARAEVLPGIRHLLPIEAADVFNATLLSFLDGLSASG